MDFCTPSEVSTSTKDTKRSSVVKSEKERALLLLLISMGAQGLMYSRQYIKLPTLGGTLNSLPFEIQGSCRRDISSFFFRKSLQDVRGYLSMM